MPEYVTTKSSLPPVVDGQKVHQWFGLTKVLHDVNVEIEPGTITSIVGPSGCGKSIFLKAVAGMIPPKTGKILIHLGKHPEKNEHEFFDIRTPCRYVGVVDQAHQLFPFWNAIENVAAGPMLDRTSIPYRLFAYPAWRKIRKQHLEEASVWLEKVGLKGHEYKLPSQLSGGQQQRVAIAQAMINKPRILLMDEPFSALDEQNREKFQRMLLTLRAENGNSQENKDNPPFTMLIVTHEINEAIYVGNRVIGFSQNWEWQDLGHKSCPGATVVYNQPSPVFNPYEPADYSLFVDQKAEILEKVFGKKDVKGTWKQKVENAQVSETIPTK